jgi:hypothetical protein
VRRGIVLRALSAVGEGKTINMGSTGMLFSTDQVLPIARLVQVFVNWPARLADDCGLRFVAWGPVVRSNGQQTAIRINKYEFRTRSSRGI